MSRSRSNHLMPVTPCRPGKTPVTNEVSHARVTLGTLETHRLTYRPRSTKYFRTPSTKKTMAEGPSSAEGGGKSKPNVFSRSSVQAPQPASSAAARRRSVVSRKRGPYGPREDVIPSEVAPATEPRDLAVRLSAGHGEISPLGLGSARAEPRPRSR